MKINQCLGCYRPSETDVSVDYKMGEWYTEVSAGCRCGMSIKIKVPNYALDKTGGISHLKDIAIDTWNNVNKEG